MQDIAPFFSNIETAIVMPDKEDENKSKEIEKEKDSKEKLFARQFVYRSITANRSLYISTPTYFKYSAYISLPDIPPRRLNNG